MFEKIIKRDGSIKKFDASKITNAIAKAGKATGEFSYKEALKLTIKVLNIASQIVKNRIPTVEEIQDIVEEVLLSSPYKKTAKAYILYRDQHRMIREISSKFNIDLIDSYLTKSDWKVKENSNMSFSLQGLNNYISQEITKIYWLNKLYPQRIKEAHENGDLHIHDLGILSPYCVGWDLLDLLSEGFKGAEGKIESKPAKHFRSILGQIVNFFYTLQGECYSADTQVLTDKGWKYFWEVKKTDKVFTLNPKTNEIELQIPVRFYEFDYNGILYHFKSKKMDLLVTPNHNMFVEQYCPKCKNGNYYKKFIKAKDFNPNIHFIPKRGTWKGERKNYFVLPEIKVSYYRHFLLNSENKYEIVDIQGLKIPMDDWLKFFGIWLAEGSITLRERRRKGRNKTYYEYQIRICQNKGKLSNEIEKVLRKLPFKYVKKEKEKKIEFVIYNKQLFSYLKKFGKAENKYIPQEIKNLSKEQLEILFEWAMKGDGYIGNGNIDYYTKSKKLADDIQEIVLKLGYSANIYEKKKGNFTWYRVSISKTKYFKFKNKNITKVKYKGKVYCLEVPNHTLFVRRNGKACWCGNSAGAQAFSNFDTLLSPFIYYDGLSYKEVKQALQEFIFNMNVPTRVGFQSPFTNITLDLTTPAHLANQAVIIGGKPQNKTYKEFKKEQDMFNKALLEVMLEGDAKGRIFTFPIPTYNIAKDFDWNNENLNILWEVTAKYGVPYFANFVNSDMKPEDVRSMCIVGSEEVLIRDSKKVKRISIRELVKNYKKDDFDEEGWADCKKDRSLEILSLNPETLKLEWAPVKRFLKIKDNKAVKVVTEDGKSALFSFKHPVPVYTPEGIKMKFVKDLQKGDCLLIFKKADENIYSKEYQKFEDFVLDEDLAKILGYFVADGNYLFESRKEYSHFGEPKGLQFTFKTGDKENLEQIKFLIKKVFNLSVHEKQDPRYNSYYLYVYNTEIARKLYKAGFLKYGRLPQILFNSPKSVIESFLEFYFRGDGYERRKEIHLNDLELSRDLVLLFSFIGKPVTYKVREKSQRIYLQHLKSGAKRNGNINTPILAERVPGWMAASTYKVPGLKKSRMVGLATLEKYNANTKESLKIKDSDIYLAKIKEIEVRQWEEPKELYDVELEKNHLFIHSLGFVSFNCCRLRIDNRKLEKRGGGLFGASPLTGSIGVVTINMPRIGYLSKTEKDFFERLEYLMELAKESLEIKRKILERLTESNLYPYSKFYLRNIKKRFNQYWKNHFSTIGLIGMNEACINFLNKDIGSKEGQGFALRVLDFMRDKLLEFQKETNNNYNLEATPAEGASFRLAKIDKEKFPQIICANEEEFRKGASSFYTNSTHLPVNYTDDIFEVLELQDLLQTKYTGGCIEKGNKVLTDKGLIKIEDIFENFGKLKPIKALSFNKEKKIAEWDEIVEAVKINVKKHNKIRIIGERNLDIITSDWHPFFVLEKFKPNSICPVCGEKIKNIKAFATHIKWNPECKRKYKTFPKYRIIEKRADELKVGDYILQNFYNMYPQKTTELNDDLMWLIGFFIGDGSISEFVDNRGGNNLKRYKVRFHSKNQEGLEKAKEIMSKYFGVKAKVIKNDKRSKPLREFTTSKRNVWEFFFKYEFKSGKKVYKVSIPQKVKENINNTNVFALLSGLIDSDGNINKRDGNVEYFTVSSKLAEDILEICSSAGIAISKSKKLTKRGNEINGWRLTIPAYEATQIKKKLAITSSNLLKIKDNLSNRKKRYLPVVRVKKISKVNVKDNQFYDLTTKKNHNYLAGKDCLVFIHNTVLHIYIGESIENPQIIKKLVRKICQNFQLPYFTITPTFSICPQHGYISGEHKICPDCGSSCEVYSRVVGYLRPVSFWNDGKREEFKLRKTFKIER